MEEKLKKQELWISHLLKSFDKLRVVIFFNAIYFLFLAVIFSEDHATSKILLLTLCLGFGINGCYVLFLKEKPPSSD